MIEDFVDRILKVGSINLTPPVDDRINLIHASDVADAVVSSVESEAWGEYNIGGEKLVTVLKIAQTCVKVMGKGKCTVLDESAKSKPIIRYDLDSALAASVFNFKAKTNLEEGIFKMWKAKTESVSA